jgi:hypothetical protein
VTEAEDPIGEDLKEQESSIEKKLRVHWYERPILRFIIIASVIGSIEICCLVCVGLTLILNWGG